MKIKIFLLLCIIGGIILGFICMGEPILQYASDKFWDVVCEQLDKEEAERERRIANGEIVRGKDTAFIWGNAYEIWHHVGELHLSFEEISKTVIEKVTKYKVVEKKLYVISQDNYAVIDQDNICRIFMNTTKDESVDDAFQDEKRISHEKIVYLSSYDDFSDEEKKIFEKLTKNKGEKVLK